jgi:hypothetical protein
VWGRGGDGIEKIKRRRRAQSAAAAAVCAPPCALKPGHRSWIPTLESRGSLALGVPLPCARRRAHLNPATAAGFRHWNHEAVWLWVYRCRVRAAVRT